MDDIHVGLHQTLINLGIEMVHQAQYCDDAYLKFKKAHLDKDAYGLLITDLSFTEDHREQRFQNGEDLISAIRKEDQTIKIIIYSIDDRLQRVRQLIQNLKVNAYVCKGRNGLKELTDAVSIVSANEQYLSPKVSKAFTSQLDSEIKDYDIALLKNLANGLSQEEVSRLFTKQGINPSSLSSIEKRISKLRIMFKANNLLHLIAITKDLGLI